MFEKNCMKNKYERESDDAEDIVNSAGEVSEEKNSGIYEGASQRNEFVEIPIGKFFGSFKLDGMRKNPWVLVSLVLIVVLIVVAFTGFGGGVTAGVVDESDAGRNLIDFINANSAVQGPVSLVSVEKQGALYLAVVNVDGEDVPVFVTLDGKYLITNPIPISGTIGVEGNDSGLDSGGGGIAGGDSGSDAGNGGAINKIEFGDAPVKGDDNAPVTIVEFSDYECPFCGRFYSETLGLIEENYISTGKAKLVFMDFPLSSIHPKAQSAALAARCAGEQGGDEAYFKMHDKLFENQVSLSDENYKKWAREIGLNGEKFDECFDSGKFNSNVLADLNYGTSLGVTGTPAFFVGNEESGFRVISGAQPYGVFEQAIEVALA